jgi:cytidylate kinase
MIITIDGPVASGKSSVAKILAKELNMYYLYTGMLYRAVAHVLLQEKHTQDDLSWIKNISYTYQNSKPHVFFNNEEITDKLNHFSLDKKASIVSADKNVRAALLDLQRDIAKENDVIADGRDCGSVVFPNADFKFYLTASVDARAKRVMSDPARGERVKDIEEIKKEIEERDKRDSERDVAPLSIPKNAIVVDSSNLTFDETVQEFLSVVQK